MNAIHAFAIAILQGVTELFPISSLGHAVIVPSLLRWPIDQHSPEFLPFLVVLHVGTAVALLIYFWREWLAIALGILRRAIRWSRSCTSDFVSSRMHACGTRRESALSTRRGSCTKRI